MNRNPYIVSTVTIVLAATGALAGPAGAAGPAAPAGQDVRTDPDDAGAPHTWMLGRPRPMAPSVWRSAEGRATSGPTGKLTFVSVDEAPEGDMPREVAYTPDGAQVLVVHRDTDNVTFFETTTNTPTHTVAVGDFPVDVAVTPDGRVAVVPNVLGDSVSIIDIATHAIVATVPVTGTQPYSVAVTPDSAFAVVGVINDGVASSFSVIDLDAGIEVQSFASGPQGVIGFFFNPESAISGNIFTQFALAPDGATIVLPDRGNDRVHLYDRATGAEVANLAIAADAIAVDVSEDSTLAVVSHEGATQLVTIIDVPGRLVSGTAVTGDNLSDQVIRITPDNSHAIAAISNNVIFVNLATGVRDATINTGSVGDIAISFDGQYAFVSNFNARLIDIATRTLVDTIPFAPCVEAATSPTELRAVALNNRFGERIHFYDIDGAGGFLESQAVSGVPAEGDVPYGVDISADGAVAISCNLTSGNASIIDVPTGTVRAHVDIGDRLKEIRITPNGTHAVVCSVETNEVAIIDLSTDTVVKKLTISDRPARVRVAPDSSEAYVLNVAGTDRISFITLDGANSQIVAQLPAGQTGSANGPTYTETSGIELSPDGTVLAVCDSFNDVLRLYDVTTRTQVAAVTVGDFPLRVAFSPDGTRAYTTNHFADTVSVVEVDGPTSSLLATVGGVGRFPLTVNVGPAGDYVYAGTRNSGGIGVDAIRVIDAATNTIVRTVAFAAGSPRDAEMAAGESILYIAATDGELVRLDAAGPASVVIDSIALSAGAPDLALNEPRKLVAVAQPIPDGVDLVSFLPCPEDLDGSGAVDFQDILAVLSAWGPCGGCPEDLDGSGAVDFQDVLAVLTAWGPC